MTLKLLKHYLYLILLWYNMLIYLCVFQQKLFEAIIFLRMIQLHLKCLHLKIIPLTQLIMIFIFKKLQRFFCRNLSELRKNSIFRIHSVSLITNFRKHFKRNKSIKWIKCKHIHVEHKLYNCSSIVKASVGSSERLLILTH